MATETTVKTRAPRAKRRDYQRELEDLRRYCEISIEVIEAITPEGAQATFLNGQADALKAVLKRIPNGSK